MSMFDTVGKAAARSGRKPETLRKWDSSSAVNLQNDAAETAFSDH